MSSLKSEMQREARFYAQGGVIFQARGVEKTYEQGGRKLKILQGIDLKIESGEIAALVGPSGSGKSTLLQIAGLLDTPSAGSIYIGDQMAGKLSDNKRTKLRNEYIGFVYQFHHLLPEFTAQENVAMPQIIGGKRYSDAMDKAGDMLRTLGLAQRLDHRPARLSGGEQQRVAIARALCNEPKLLFADEPTGNLDPDTSADVFNILLDQVRKRGIGALIATHNHELAEQMDRIYELKGGRLMLY